MLERYQSAVLSQAVSPWVQGANTQQWADASYGFSMGKALNAIASNSDRQSRKLASWSDSLHEGMVVACHLLMLALHPNREPRPQVSIHLAR